jgi:phosphatidylserine/phosphatidylglycerophosphate/cardiolipin synthase-like enzyme
LSESQRADQRHGESRVALVEDGTLGELLFAEIDAAKQRIRIATYLYTLDIRADPNNPVRRITAALVRAAARGINSRVLLGVPADSRLATLNCITGAYLIARGIQVKVASTPALHTKLAIVDDHFGSVASHNLTPRAFTSARELAVAVWSSQTCGALSSHFDALWAQASDGITA